MLEEKYGLCYAYPVEQYGNMIQQIEQLLAHNPVELKNEWQEKRGKMLDEMVEPTAFFVDYIEKNYGLHTK